MSHGLELPVERGDDRDDDRGDSRDEDQRDDQRDDRGRADEMASDTREDTGLLWGVGAVAIRLGIATPTLRTWERRYGIGPSRRTDGGHRRYSEDDIGRVQLMQRLVGGGVPAQSAARVAVSLEPADLEAALSAPEPSAVDGQQARRPTSAPPVAVASVIRAAKDLDRRGLDQIYAQVLEDFGVVEAWADVFVPALKAIGEQWSDGTLGVESEHLASHRLAAGLDEIARAHAPPRNARAPVLLCGADEDMHELPLLAVEAALAVYGVACHSLGARVPSGALGASVARLDPAVVFLWASLDRAESDGTLALLGSIDVPVLVGGPGWPDGVLRGVERCGDLAAVVDRLRALTG